MMTIVPEEIGELLFHKYILLDNNVITRAHDHPGAFRPFLELLVKHECQPIITPLIRFEYLRGSISKEHTKTREEFIDLINADTLANAYTEESIEKAIKIANIYATRKLFPNAIDCSLAANIMHFKDILFLATVNHKDFPTFLLERVGVFTVATEKDVIPIGIYGYNASKANTLNLV
jgi:predicted nucleic acid-binding protein